jgi:hypothetical protein
MHAKKLQIRSDICINSLNFHEPLIKKGGGGVGWGEGGSCPDTKW